MMSTKTAEIMPKPRIMLNSGVALPVLVITPATTTNPITVMMQMTPMTNDAIPRPLWPRVTDGFSKVIVMVLLPKATGCDEGFGPASLCRESRSRAK